MHINGAFLLIWPGMIADLCGFALDERNIPALNRVGDPDDIIATVLVQDSKVRPHISFSVSILVYSHLYQKIIAETYQAMPAYRVCTADGVTQLTDGLAKKLKEILEQKVAEEQMPRS
jgi:hypothetical protein